MEPETLIGVTLEDLAEGKWFQDELVIDLDAENGTLATLYRTEDKEEIFVGRYNLTHDGTNVFSRSYNGGQGYAREVEDDLEEYLALNKVWEEAEVIRG